MQEEYKTTLNIYKQEKIKIIDELKNFNGPINYKKNLLQNIEYIDDMIEKYSYKLSNNNENKECKSKPKVVNNQIKNSNSKSKSTNKNKIIKKKKKKRRREI